MRALLISLALLAGACEEEAVSVTFTVECYPIPANPTVSLEGKMVQFYAAKLDYNHYEIEGTRITNQEGAFAHSEGGPLMADFYVGYKLHRLDQQEERAHVQCSLEYVDELYDLYRGMNYDEIPFSEASAALGSSMTVKLNLPVEYIED